MLKDEIKKVLGEYRDRVTSMGEFFDDKPTIQALTRITEIIEEEKTKMKIEVDEEKLKEIIINFIHPTMNYDTALINYEELAHTVATRVSEWIKVKEVI